MHEYLIDCDVVVALRVKASSAAEARKMVDTLLDCADARFGRWPNGDPATGEATVQRRSIAEIDGLPMENNAAVHEFESGETRYRLAAEAKGWRHGGDFDGFIYDSNVFDSWKEAASWAGDEDCGDEDMASSVTYATWRECCEGEGIEVGG